MSSIVQPSVGLVREQIARAREWVADIDDARDELSVHYATIEKVLRWYVGEREVSPSGAIYGHAPTMQELSHESSEAHKHEQIALARGRSAVVAGATYFAIEWLRGYVDESLVPSLA